MLQVLVLVLVLGSLVVINIGIGSYWNHAGFEDGCVVSFGTKKRRLFGMMSSPRHPIQNMSSF